MPNDTLLILEKMKSAIRHIVTQSRDFVKDPARDFTRNRKLSLGEVITAFLCMEGGSLNIELLRYFKCSQNAASRPAFIQQRHKINDKAFPTLFNTFIKFTDCAKLYKGFRLLAADGSDILIPANKDEQSSYFPGANGQSPYNLLHLNAIYDLLRHTYLDVDICGRRDWNEQKALAGMTDCSSIANALLMADRGYENYNLMAHIQEKGWKYLIRIRDVGSTGIISGLELPTSDEFDLFCPMHLTRRRTADVEKLLVNKNQYKCIASAPFDYLKTGARKKDPVDFYYLPFRIVRFKLSDSSYETVITNLDPNDFPPAELKKLYKMRWGIETSFRELKYALGLLHFHAKKVENILQEIYAKLIMYNFTELITAKVIIQKKERKYDYEVNFSAAVHVCRQFLRGSISPPDVEATLCRNITPVRPDRSFPRQKTVKRTVSFVYRVA